MWVQNKKMYEKTKWGYSNNYGSCVLNGTVPTTGRARIIYENEIILKDNKKDLSHLFKSGRQNAARAVKIRGLLIDFHFRSRLFWSSFLYPFFSRLLQKIGDLQRWFLESSQIFEVFGVSMPRTKIAPRNPKQAGAGFRVSYRPMPNGLRNGAIDVVCPWARNRNS